MMRQDLHVDLRTQDCLKPCRIPELNITCTCTFKTLGAHSRYTETLGTGCEVQSPPHTISLIEDTNFMQINLVQ